MNITILSVTAQRNRVRRVIKAEEVKSTHTALIARGHTDSHGVVGLLVNHNVVAASKGKCLVEVACQVFVIAEEHRGIGGVDLKKLLLVSEMEILRLQSDTCLAHVENLHAVALELAADEHVVVIGADLGPVCAVGHRGPFRPGQVSMLRL